ncbi:uncharacterized protein [Rutidosis leptorrhynchoides]|uniref:uncharacterized protein n=1 Tax=Rutidosis leptorrhynchoides TaxID=125765 RepID=UPI003A998BE9
MAYHVWCLITRKQSLWVRWIHSYRLVDKSFWKVDIPATASYSWRKILNMRGMIRPFIIHKVGNGANTSAWYDSWTDYDNLSDFISHREIVRAGFSNVSRVAELIFNNAWNWPVCWSARLPMHLNINPPDPNTEDVVCWKNAEGDLVEFSTRVAWDSLRPRAEVVMWYPIIWFPQQVPCHDLQIGPRRIT